MMYCRELADKLAERGFKIEKVIDKDDYCHISFRNPRLRDSHKISLTIKTSEKAGKAKMYFRIEISDKKLKKPFILETSVDLNPKSIPEDIRDLKRLEKILKNLKA